LVGVTSIEVKTEADSNDITDIKPTLTMFAFPISLQLFGCV